MGLIDDLIANNERYAENFDKGGLQTPPRKKLAVVACMDSRMDVFAMLGIGEGDAHIIRNAGGVVTDDEIRSLAISQHLLGTEAIVLIHHTDCGLLRTTDEEFAQKMEEEAGEQPSWKAEAFDDVDESVRNSIATLKSSPFIPRTDEIRGFVYDVETGRLREVT